jgi:hypothetical protein
LQSASQLSNSNEARQTPCTFPNLVIVSARPSQFLFDWPPVSARESHWRKFDTSRQGHDTAHSVSLDGSLQTHIIDKGNMDHTILRLTYGWGGRVVWSLRAES